MPEQRITVRHDVMTVNRASRMLGVSRPSVVKRIRDGELGAERIGTWFFVNRADVERLARERLNIPRINA